MGYKNHVETRDLFMYRLKRGEYVATAVSGCLFYVVDTVFSTLSRILTHVPSYTTHNRCLLAM
jgi:hypothetical protein